MRQILRKYSIPFLIFALVLKFTLAFADTTISNGLTLTFPSEGARNWYQVFTDYTTAISGHDHTGSGKGLPIGSNALSANAVTGAKFRLANNEALRARNVAGSADIDLFKLDTSNRFALLPQTIYYDNATTVIASDTADGADTKTLALTGGGAYAAGRGANLLLQGEQAGGGVSLFSENAAVNIAAGGANAVIIAANGNTGINILSTGAVNIPLVTASLPVFTDAAKSLVTPSIATARTNLGLGTGNTPSFTGVTISGATASLPVFTDGSKNLVSQSVATTWSTLNAAATYTAWVPTLSGDGTASLGSTSIGLARYIQIGKQVHLILEFTGTISGGPSNSVAFTLPITAASIKGVSLSGWYGTLTGSSALLYGGLNSTGIAVIKTFSPVSNVNFANGAYTWEVSMTYEAA